MLDGQGADEIFSLLQVMVWHSVMLGNRCNAFVRTLLNSWSANASLTPSTTFQYLVATLLSPCAQLA